jgi:ABC-type glycerol-3-phosphate transport system permease component
MRRESTAKGGNAAVSRRRALVHLVLAGACLPALLPFFWLVGSSLQQRENVFRSPPRWLPVTERATLSLHGADVPVNVVDRNEQTGAWRVRIQPGTPELRLPPASVRVVTNRIVLARFGGLEQRVEPVSRDIDGSTVRVRVPGRHRRVEVRNDEVEESVDELWFLEAFRQEITIDPATWEIAEPGDPFPAVTARIEDDGTVLRIEANGSRIPVEKVGAMPGAGLSVVRPVPGKVVGTLDPGRLRSRTLRRYTYRRDPAGPECRWLRRPTADRRGVILIPGEFDEIEVPAESLRVETSIAHFTRLLGQDVELRRRPDEDASWDVVDPLVAAADRFEEDTFFDPQWRNYPMALRREPFHLYVVNTLFITICCVLGNVLSCGIVGYAFARIPFRGRNILFLLLLSTMMVPGQVTMIPTFALFTRLGWLDTYIPLILPAFLAQSAFFVFLYRQFFLSIPLELEDAARVDGAGPLRTFWHIMLPIAKPAAVTVGVFSFLAAWNDFLGPLLYINSDERQTLALGLQNFKTSFGYSDPHYLMAASLLMMIPTLVIFFSAQRAFMRGVVVTGLKG